MFRDLVSHLVLILVPVISLTIAIAPFVWVKRKIKSERVRKFESEKENPNTQSRSHPPTFPPSNFHTIPLSHIPPWISTPRLTARLWLSFVIGLVGNVVWWWLVGMRPSSLSLYTGDSESTGVIFSFFLYSFFVAITPFIFYKLKHGHFSGKAIVYNLIVSLLTAGIVLGVWIVLAVNAYRGIFERLN